MVREMVTVDIRNHIDVPEHVLLSEKEVNEILEKMDISKDKLPKILVTDPVVRLMGGKQGEVVKIIRESVTAGIDIAYRVIIEP